MIFSVISVKSSESYISKQYLYKDTQILKNLPNTFMPVDVEDKLTRHRCPLCSLIQFYSCELDYY